jgi:hypothetical protein
MTILEIKNMTTKKMVELKCNLEKEIEFRKNIGNEINQQQEAINRLKVIRDYQEKNV